MGGIYGIPELFAGGRNLVEGHAVHLYRLRVLLLFVVDVPHVHSQSPRLRVLLVLDNQLVSVQGFFVHLIVVVSIGEVKADCVGQVEVDLLGQIVRLAEFAQAPLSFPSFFGFLKYF